jgi:hypothetical protein
MNLIVYSGNEAFKKGAQKIKEDALQQNKKCDVIELEDFSEVINKIQADCIYFLSSDKRISKFCKILKDKNCKVINVIFLLNDINTSKYDSMEKAFRADVCIPKNLELNLYKITDCINTPLFIKTKNPRGLVKKCSNNNLIINEIKQIPEQHKKSYYLEEDVSSKDCLELKIYYVNGKVFFMDVFSENNNFNWLHSTMEKISKCTDLEVFSVDFIADFKKQKYHCIDINHASSFFKSSAARNEFITNILQ